MAAFRQSVVLTVCLLVFQIIALILADMIISQTFAVRLEEELRERFEAIANEIEAGGFDATNYAGNDDEVVFFAADPVSAQAAPHGIFDLRGVLDDDALELLDYENLANWHFFVGEVSGSVLAIGSNQWLRSLYHRVILPVFGVLLIGVSALVVGVGVYFGLYNQRRLNRILETLDRVALGEFDSRVGAGVSGDDLDDLAQSIDRILDRLQRLFDQLRNLSENIAHDLKTPLARLRLALENAILLKDSKDTATSIEGALEQADQVIAIFEAILRISHIETGNIQKRFEVVEMKVIAEEVAEMFSPIMEDAGYTFGVDAEDWKAIQGDVVLLKQMLVNLTENALLHTPPGSHVMIVSKDGEIGVVDNGPGISEAHYDEAIKPSVRLNTSRSTPGSGLGLALVKAIVEAHGAELIFSNNPQTPGKGMYVRARFE